MRFSTSFRRRLQLLNLPGALLLLLLQRTPVLRLLVSTEPVVVAAPAGAMLKSAVAGLVGLGALHSRAGATELVTNEPSPLRATVGVAVPKAAFILAGTQTQPSIWNVTGSLPPGLLINDRATLGTFAAPVLVLTGTPTAAGTFQLGISGSGAGYTSPSLPYTLTVVAAGTPATFPVFSTQPASVTVAAGASVTLTAAVAGSPAPTYQWRRYGSNLGGQTSATLILTNVQPADAGAYTLVAINSAGTATSNAANVTVTSAPAGAAPVVTLQPVSITAALGAPAVLTVAATGAPTIQWRKNGVNLPGATAATLAFSALTAADTASYDAVLTNAAGTEFSGTAVVIATTPLTARLRNLSVRTTLAAEQILFVGLNLAGGSKDVLLRAAGPGLGALGVGGTMADPRLAVFTTDAPPVQIAQNNDWSGNAAVRAANAALGAFPFPSDASLDAALVTPIAGGRTVQVSGPTAGGVIVEAYDNGSGNAVRFTSLSARNLVGTGANLLFVGFTIDGAGTKNLLFRAAGPSLGALGVPNTLVDPKLELFTTSTPAAKIAENDTYAAALAPLFRTLGAFDFVPGAKDAALVLSLPAGSYTVQVLGANNGTGDAIVEVYELP